MDGQTVKTSDLPSKGNWLLIYVSPSSHFSSAMLKQMTKDQYPLLAANAVFLVGGTLDDAKTILAKYPDLATASWYADPNREAFIQLKLHSMPSVVGVNQQTMKWAVSGMAPDAATFKTIVNSWLDQAGSPK
jgi:hypothetical protein